MTHPVTANQSLINHRRCIVFFLIIATLTGCINQTSSATQPEDVFLTPGRKITFFVFTPTDTPPDADIYLDLVDDVTGINLNPERHKMTSISENLYSFELHVQDGSFLKYRYAMGSNPTVIEHNTFGKPVQYRVFANQVDDPLVARDVIASWTDSPINVSLGRLKGILIDSSTGAGIPDMLINLNGMQATSTLTGEFLLSNALPGKYLLTLYSKDGQYGPFQQEAIIAPEACTPVELSLTAHPTVQITFKITPPADHVPSSPIRLIGNIQSLGNSFSISPSDTDIIPIKAPEMELQPDGTYSLTIDIPSGIDLRYKYTMGDGFWNAERLSDGQFVTRQLIIPDENTTIQETIASWHAGNRQPITLQAIQKETGDSPDQLYIQLNSFTWTAPLPMWQANNGEWQYKIYSPLYLFPSIGYRFCWDEICDTVIPLDEDQILEPERIPTDGSQIFIQHTIPSHTHKSD